MALAGVLVDALPPEPEAEVHARLAVQLEPAEVQHWVVLGEVLLSLDRADEARAVAQQALNRPMTVGDRVLLEAFLARVSFGR